MPRPSQITAALCALVLGGGLAVGCGSRSEVEQGNPGGETPASSTPKANPTGATQGETATPPQVTETTGTLPEPTEDGETTP